MKLEEEMYIRNEDGYILNLTKENIYGYKSLIGSSNIKIKSYDIIDLIQVGDYINGYLVTFVYKPDGNKVFRIERERDTLKGHIISKSEQIKSIVTKEQFNSIKYEVDSNE